MVSPTPATPAQAPVLSYAESAKKAQGVKPASLHTQKHLSNPPRQPQPPAPASAPVPEPKKPGKPSPPVEVAQVSLADLSQHDAFTPGAPGANPPSHSSTSISDSTPHISNTRDVASIDSPSAGVVPTPTSSQPPPAKAAPVPNVWNQRMIQQRVQARSQPRPPQSLPQAAPSHVPRAPSPPRDLSGAPSGSRQPDVVISASAPSTQSTSSSSLNGASSTSASGSSAGTTPSSRKDLPLSPHPLPLVADAESWPEVGKGHIPTSKSQRVGNGHPAVAEVHDVEEKVVGTPSSSHPGTPRKNGNAKRIAIPPEELQPAADAINPPRSYSQSRSSARNNQTRSTAASASGSAQGSQAPSKVASGRTSAAHSRVHSPKSVAASPQHPGRGRQLPVESTSDQTPAEQQQRSSQGNSPRPPADISLAAPVPYVQISREVYGYSNLPSQTTNAQSFVSPPPPPPPPHFPPALHVNPTHAQQPYASSSVSPYPQPYAHHNPPDRYGPAPTQPLPPGWPAPEHYVYQYGYPPYAQTHPMMYWPSNLPLDLRQDGRAMYPPYPPVHPPQQVAPPAHVLQDEADPPRGEESATHPTLPPPTMIARPPPPQESEAVAGYRAVGPVSDSTSSWEEAARGKRDVMFGSIGASGVSKSPSPPPPPSGLPSGLPPLSIEDQSGGGGEKPERVVMTFSIGVAPGEAGPSHLRSRMRSQPRLSPVESATDGNGEPHTPTGVKVVDPTDAGLKWEFGTANRAQDEPTQGDENRPEPSEAPSRPLAPAVPLKSTLDISLLFSGPMQGSSLPVAAAEPPLAELQHVYPHPHHPIPYVLPQQQIHGPPLPPPQDELHVQTGPGPYPVHQPPSQPLSSSSADGFEVKDYGYGFGRGSGPAGHAMSSSREERLPREREWERSREAEREPYTWRPRRGSYSGHNERGGYAGRRGRGMNGYGRGVPGRGGYGRGFRNHHFQQHQHHHQQHQHQQHQKQQQQQHQQQQQPPPPPPPLTQQQQQHQQQLPQPQQVQQPPPPFTVTPPAQAFQPLQPSTPPPRAPTDVGQYHGTTIQQPPYMSHGFEAYQTPVQLPYTPTTPVSGSTSGHPLPRPLSNLTFPLDPTRYYLLGQLEYYLSAQNLVSDIFLRKRMDSRGWIPITLLASFNRVRQLTLDPQLVRDVLALSQIAEMRDDHVRMAGGEWAQFVLPDAPVSTVEGGIAGVGDGEEDGDVEEEEEEEEIEIVMDREVIGQPWMAPLSS